MSRALSLSTPGFLRLAIAALLVSGCGDDANSFPTGDNDAEVEFDAAVEDTGPGLDFDIAPLDTGSPEIDIPVVSMDTGRPDTGVRPDTGQPDTGVRPDTGASVCPSSCATNSDCNPCRSAGETGNYCCISGLCLYMTDMCSTTVPSDVPMSGGDGGGDGGGGGDAGGGLDAGGGADASGGFDAGGGAG